LLLLLVDWKVHKCN